MIGNNTSRGAPKSWFKDQRSMELRKKLQRKKVRSVIAKDLRSHLNNLRKSENCLDTKKTTKAENDKGGNEKR